MRIHLLTSGAAGMYCGSCIRDNALARELRAQGHNVALIPTYTPTLTDEPNVSERHIYFGGVSVYLEQNVALFRRAPRFLSRLLDSPALLRLLSKISIRTEPQALGELTVSMLRGEDGPLAAEFEKLVEGLGELPCPDVVCLPHSLLIAAAAPLRSALGVPVCCTLQGEDLFLEGLREPCRSEALSLIRACVADVDAFLPVSDYYAGFMRDYLRIPPEKMHVVPLGIHFDGYPATPRAPRPGAPFTIGYFARVTPEKSLHLLAEAYILLRRDRGLPASRLEAAGYLAPEFKKYLRGIEGRFAAAGLAGEFRYRGVLSRDQKIRFLSGLDVISVPSTYAEPKGIYLLEAMACGVPFVEPDHGAFPELAAKTSAGVLFEPDNVASLAGALHELWHYAPRRAALGRNGFDAVRRHYSAARMAAATVAVLETVLAARRARETPATAPA